VVGNIAHLTIQNKVYLRDMLFIEEVFILLSTNLSSKYDLVFFNLSRITVSKSPFLSESCDLLEIVYLSYRSRFLRKRRPRLFEKKLRREVDFVCLLHECSRRDLPKRN